jgi:hypothetical protein
METKGKPMRRRRRYRSLMWPVLLIMAGVILLLGYLGVLNVSFWELWRLWPVLIILIGLDLLLGRSSAVGSLIVLLITLAVVAGVIIVLIAAPNALGSAASRSVEDVTEPLGDAERAELALDLGAGTLTLEGLEDSSALIEGTLKLTTGRESKWDVNRSAGVVRVSLDGGTGSAGWVWGGDEWDLGVSPLVGLSLNAELGAGQETIDLRGLDIRNLKVHTGAGQLKVTFPEKGVFAAMVGGGVGRLELVIPESLAARVQIDRGLSSLDIAGRFKQVGDFYVTGDWATNPNKVDIKLDIGLGLLSVR